MSADRKVGRVSRRDFLRTGVFGTALVLTASGLLEPAKDNKEQEQLPEGKFIFLRQSLMNPEVSLYTLDFPSNDQKEVYKENGAFIVGADASRDGSKVVLLKEKFENNKLTTKSIKVIDMRTGEAIDEFGMGNMMHVRLSPDGEEIFYDTIDTQQNKSVLHRYSLQERRDIKEIPFDFVIDGFSLNPQIKNQLAVTQIDNDQIIRVVDITGGSPAVLTEITVALGMDWSPDGTQIVYDKVRVPNTNQIDLIIHNIATGKDIALIKNGEIGIWSPDGKYIAFTMVLGENGLHRIIRKNLPNVSVKNRIENLVDTAPVRLAMWDTGTGKVIFLGRDHDRLGGPPPYPFTWLTDKKFLTSEAWPFLIGKPAVVNKDGTGQTEVFNGRNQVDRALLWIPAPK